MINMIHVDKKRVTLNGVQGELVAEAGAVIDTLAERLYEDLAFGYELALQIIIESIYRGCTMTHDAEEKKNRR